MNISQKLAAPSVAPASTSRRGGPAFPQKLDGIGGALNEPASGAVLFREGKPSFTADQVRKLLRAEVARLGGQRAYSKARSVNQAQVSKCLAGGEVTDAIAASLRLLARRVFEPAGI